jgi:hypothetical protein
VERTTIARETEELGENLPQRHFVPPQIPHDQVRFRTPDRSSGKPATNRLSYGTAFDKYLKDNLSKEQNRVVHSSACLSNIPRSKYQIFNCRIDPGETNLSV